MCTFQCRGACEGLALGFLIWIFKPPYLDPVCFFFFFFPPVEFSSLLLFCSFLLPSPTLSSIMERGRKQEEGERVYVQACIYTKTLEVLFPVLVVI